MRSPGTTSPKGGNPASGTSSFPQPSTGTVQEAETGPFAAEGAPAWELSLFTKPGACVLRFSQSSRYGARTSPSSSFTVNSSVIRTTGSLPSMRRRSAS